MAVTHPPSVFVSSTCYDLTQVRHDLREFFISMGLVPILSEFPSFPVDPNLDAVGNCLACVKETANIFVLVVGGRYGSSGGGGKSVTNLEYLEAKAKGIPRYVFVQKPVLTTLPIWQMNRSSDFARVVDTPKLFEFVESLRDPKENWVFPFDTAQDIVGILRTQLAYLFMDALTLRTKVMGCGLPELLQGLSGTALLLAVQKPFAWEYLLFGQVVHDEMAKMASVKRDLDYGIVLGRAVRLNDIADVVQWVLKKMGEIASFVESGTRLVNITFPQAIGAEGQSGDVENIVYVGRRFADVYRLVLEWTVEFRHTQVDDEYSHLLEIIARASNKLIPEIETFVLNYRNQIAEAVLHEGSNEPQSLKITLTLSCPDMDDLAVELSRLSEIFGVEKCPVFDA